MSIVIDSVNYGKGTTVLNSSTIGTAFNANASGTGVVGESDSPAGTGVRGHVTNASGGTIGVEGRCDSTGGMGVWGHAPFAAGTIGVLGWGGAGVVGVAENVSVTPQTSGVCGLASTGIGVLGESVGGGVAGSFTQGGGSPGGNPALLVSAMAGNYLLARFQNASVNKGEDRTALVNWETGDNTPVNWNVAVGGTNNGFGLTKGQFYLENLGKGVRFLIDGSGNVGIGTTSPAEFLHVSNSGNNLLMLQSTTGGTGNTANLDFQTYSTITQLYPSARISVIDAGSYSAHFAFLTKTPGANSNSLVERMRITDVGKVGIGTSSPQTTLQVNGGVSVAVKIVEQNYTMTTSDFTILAYASTGPLIITLPAALNKGMLVFVKKTDSTANVVTILVAGADTIEGSATKTLSAQNNSYTLIADGGSPGTWYIQSTAT